MGFAKKKSVYIRPALAALAMLFLASPAYLHAQGCAMCYQSAAASGARLIHALKNGIVILMIPPLLMTGFFARLVYRRRNVCNEEFVDDSADEIEIAAS